jgi:catechol 2,3-dioxygenase-like lactoylglutathione lyase family enzyme
MQLRVVGLDHFVLRVRDLDKSLGFYRDVLGLPIEFLDEYRAGTRPFVSARVGGQLIDLVPDPNYNPEAGFLAGGFCISVLVSVSLAEVCRGCANVESPSSRTRRCPHGRNGNGAVDLRAIR